jgi:hypothetical protein
MYLNCYKWRFRTSKKHPKNEPADFAFAFCLVSFLHLSSMPCWKQNRCADWKATLLSLVEMITLQALVNGFKTRFNYQKVTFLDVESSTF